MARLYQKINNEAVPLGGGGGGSVAIDNDTITENSDGEIQVATTLTGKINQLNNVAADMGKVLTANGNGTAEWDDILVPIDYETITKNSNGELQVSSVPYDNTESGLTADNVQDAIDEVSASFIIDETEHACGKFLNYTRYIKAYKVTSQFLLTTAAWVDVPQFNVNGVAGVLSCKLIRRSSGYMENLDAYIKQDTHVLQIMAHRATEGSNPLAPMTQTILEDYYMILEYYK